MGTLSLFSCIIRFLIVEFLLLNQELMQLVVAFMCVAF